MPKKISLESFNAMERVAKIMKEQELSAGQIIEVLRLPKVYSSYTNVRRLLILMGNHYPVYEPIPGHFKILTESDMDEYQQLYRRQKDARRYDMEKTTARPTHK